MREVRIYKPAKTAMQSGKARTKSWVIDFVHKDLEYIEPLMNWVGSYGTTNEINLSFASKEAAIDFAKSKGWPYTVQEPQQRRFTPKSYIDNFLRKV